MSASPVIPSEFLAKIPQTTQDPCTALANALLAYPQLMYQFVTWMIDSSGELTDEFIDEIYDAGDYKNSANSGLDTGTGTRWLLCDGRMVSQTTYAALFAVLGSTFGATGSGTFKLPDCRGKFSLPVSASHAIAETGGLEDVTLTVNQMPAHSHSVTLLIDTATNGNNSLSDQSDGSLGLPYATDSKGGGASHENMPPYLVGGYTYIKT